MTDEDSTGSLQEEAVQVAVESAPPAESVAAAPEAAPASTSSPQAESVEAPVPTETRQIPVFGGLPDTPVEPPSEPPPTPEVAPAVSAPSAASGKSPGHDRELLKIARAKIQTKKQQNFGKILALFEKHEKITNDAVERELRCSDRTATRYLSALEKEGKIRQVGSMGKGVVYTKL